MIVCDICGKKIENDDTENYIVLSTGNYIALNEDIFYANVCSNCLISVHNFIENKRGEKK